MTTRQRMIDELEYLALNRSVDPAVRVEAVSILLAMDDDRDEQALAGDAPDTEPGFLETGWFDTRQVADPFPWLADAPAPPKLAPRVDVVSDAEVNPCSCWVNENFSILVNHVEVGRIHRGMTGSEMSSALEVAVAKALARATA